MIAVRTRSLVVLAALWLAATQALGAAHAAEHHGPHEHEHEGVPCVLAGLSEQDEDVAPPPVPEALRVPPVIAAPVRPLNVRDQAPLRAPSPPGAPPTGPPFPA